jgi:hypothetical protein
MWTSHAKFAAAPHTVRPLAYNEVGHLCPRTNRRAITLRRFHEIGPDVWGYLYNPEAAEFDMEPWRVVEDVDPLVMSDGTPRDVYDVWLASGRCRENQPGDTVLYVASDLV